MRTTTALCIVYFVVTCSVVRADVANRRTPVVQVYEKTRRAVVNISGQGVVSAVPEHDWFDGFFGTPRYQRVKVLGSGVVVHERGFVVTNSHVVEGASDIKVIFSDGKEFAAELIRTDSDRDLAILKIQAEDALPVIELGQSSDLMIGETVIAIGNPYGYANTVTSGILSALGRDIQVSEGFWLRGLIQTDAPINPGNSGGPLLNIDGELIGINTVIRAEAQNIGFSIPVDTLVNNLSHMLMPEKLRRVRLGLVVARTRVVGPYTGLVVDAVGDSTPADQAGLRSGDLILKIDGHRLTNVIDFYIRLMDKEPGQPMDLEYVRPTEQSLLARTTRLTLADRPIPDGAKLAERFFQMQVSELNEQVARKFDFDQAYPLLIIQTVQPKGTAAETGLRPQDLILAVNGVAVRNMREFSFEMEKVSEADPVRLEILRIRIGRLGQVQQRYSVEMRARPASSKEGTL